MRNKTIAVILALQLGSAQAAAPVTTAAVVPPDWAERTAPRAAMTSKLIKESVTQAIAEHDAEAKQNAEPIRRHEHDTFRGTPQDNFARKMEEAVVPGCLRPDGLKNQPTGIGPFQLVGLLALPMVAVAKLRGKCN